MNLLPKVPNLNDMIDEVSAAVSTGLENGITNSTAGISEELEELLINLDSFLSVLKIGTIISTVVFIAFTLMFLVAVIKWYMYLSLSIKVNKLQLKELQENQNNQ